MSWDIEVVGALCAQLYARDVGAGAVGGLLGVALRRLEGLNLV